MKTHTPVIQIPENERTKPQIIIRCDTHHARTITRARILLLSHDRGGKDTTARTFGVNQTTVRDVRNRYKEGGLTRALYHTPRSGKPRKVDATL